MKWGECYSIVLCRESRRGHSETAVAVGSKLKSNQKLVSNWEKLIVEEARFYCDHSNQVFALSQDTKENYCTTGYQPSIRSIKLWTRKATHQLMKLRNECVCIHDSLSETSQTCWAYFERTMENKRHDQSVHNCALPRSKEIEKYNHQALRSRSYKAQHPMEHPHKFSDVC